MKRWLYKLLCEKLGHNFYYYMMDHKRLRCCKRCMQLDVYRDIPIYGIGWFALVMYNKKSVKETLKKQGIEI